METTPTDRIEKQISIDAPLPRVWDAISDAQKFGEWFRVDMTGQKFEAGKPVQGKMTYPGFEGKAFEIVIDRIEPMRLFSYRWHPAAIDASYDYSGESMTLVTFELAEADGGTLLTMIETGFDSIPLARRAEAFRMNTGGWEMQLGNITAYVTGKN